MRCKWQMKRKLSTNVIVMNIKFRQTYRVEVETPASKAVTRNEFCLAYNLF